MNKLIEYFARQKVLAELITVLVIVVGLVSGAFLIQREVFPNVQYEIISVYTVYPGASPDETERLITSPLEQDLKEVTGIKKMTSLSAEGRSGIVIQLDSDQVTPEAAEADIQDVVDQFRDLPDGAEDPVVMSIESTIIPIIEVHVSGDMEYTKLRDAAKWLEKEVEEISQVAKVDLAGSRKDEIRIEVDLKKMARQEISFDEIIGALKMQNVSVPGGDFYKTSKEGYEKEVIIRTQGDFRDIEDVKRTVVRANEVGKPILVGDIAEVKFDLEDVDLSFRTDGKEAIKLTVLKKSNADAIDLIDNLKEKLDNIESPMLEGVKISYINDLSQLIRRRLGILTGNLAIGLILVLIVLSIFLPFRVALVTSIGIPFSFLGAMWVFNSYDISLNMISMMGLIIVIGMLVDDAVVVTENAVRWIEKGFEPMDAAIKSVQEIWPAVTASVLTTVLAFFPMTIMTGIFGKFIKFIPIGVIIALMISLFECFFILPSHVGKFVKSGTKIKEKKWWTRTVNWYVGFLSSVLRFRYLVLLGFIGLIVATGILVSSGMKKILFPPDGIEIFMVRIEAQTGTSLEQMGKFMVPIEDKVAALKKNELKNFVTTFGEWRQSADDPGVKRGGHYAQVMVFLSPETERSRKASEVIDFLREDIGKPEGLKSVVFERVKAGPPTGKAISVGVRGAEYDYILQMVTILEEKLKTIKGTTDIENNYSLGKKEIHVQVDSVKAATAGLTVAAVGNAVRAGFEGVVATTLKKLDEEVDIRVTTSKKVKLNAESLDSLLVANNRGQLIPLKTVAKFKDYQGIEGFYHENNLREVKIFGDVDTDITSSNEVNNMLRKDILPDLLKQFPGLSVSFGGEDFDTAESMQSLGRAFILAFVLIYFLLILTFGSLTKPLLVVCVIPLGVISVIFSLFIHNQPISFMAMLGVIALSGVIVNNAIVYVDFVLKQRKKGVDYTTSIIEAGKMRLRPIFLTTLTTACGILPTAYGIGGLDKFVVPIALALGWGMLWGSVLSVIFLPAFIAMMDDVGNLFTSRS